MRIRSLIEQGRLRPGERIPSLRAYAMELGVARGTVEVAYDRLQGDGFLVTRGSSGTFVAGPETLPTAMGLRSIRPAALKLSGIDLYQHSVSPCSGCPLPFQLGLPALDKFPRKLWARLITAQARAAEPLIKPPYAGHWPLREALARYLLRSRGIDVCPDQVFVMPAYTASIALIVDALGLAGHAAWVENPGYPPAAHALFDLGMTLHRVPVDSEGIDVRYGIQNFPEARLAVTTPSHQCPTGVELALNRRTALIAWAASNCSWIIEDDYDGEFRYRGYPLPALKSLDTADRVFYCGTLSKVLYPGLRLSYLVAPLSQIHVIEEACRRSMHGGSPDFLQAVAARFINEGHFGRHIKKMRTLYARRRAMLANALRKYEAHRFTVQLQEGGMHLLVEVGDCDDVALARRGREAGFGIQALNDWKQGEPGMRAVMLGFTNINSQAEAEEQVARLMEVISPRCGSRN